MTTSDLPPVHPPEYLLRNVVLFIRLLRRAGIAVSTEQMLGFVDALGTVGIASRDDVFCVAQALLVTRREDRSVFEVIFNRFWKAGAGTAPVRARHRDTHQRPGTPTQGTFTIANYAAYKAREIERDVPVEDRRGTWSALDVLRSRSFAELTPHEQQQLKRLMRELPWKASLRRTRRLLATPSGPRPDLRRALRQAVRSGGLVMKIPRRTRKMRERPIVFLADISGSMADYTRAALQFLHAGLRKRPNVEAFVFGSRLTRLTTQLKLRNVDQALRAAATMVVDWDGGTRIGASLHEFNRRWARRVLRRGAVAVILSDGLDRGDVSALRRELRWLRDRAWRLVWLNPLAGSDRFEPAAEGMAAAREFIDDLLPAHNFDSLERFAESLRTLPRRRPVRRSSRGLS